MGSYSKIRALQSNQDQDKRNSLPPGFLPLYTSFPDINGYTTYDDHHNNRKNVDYNNSRHSVSLAPIVNGITDYHHHLNQNGTRMENKKSVKRIISRFGCQPVNLKFTDLTYCVENEQNKKGKQEFFICLIIF